MSRAGLPWMAYRRRRLTNEEVGKMSSIEAGLIGMFAIIGLGGAALAAALILLHKRGAEPRKKRPGG